MMEATTTGNVENLWSTKFDFGIGDVTPPIAILKQQAALLGQQTRNIVVANVYSNPARSGAMIQHTFAVNSPSLSYSTELFTVISPVQTMYPAEIYALENPPHQQKPDIAQDETTFKKKLREMLASEKVVSVIQALIVQSVATAG